MGLTGLDASGTGAVHAVPFREREPLLGGAHLLRTHLLTRSPCAPCTRPRRPLPPQFLRAVSEGMAALLLDRADLQRPPTRVICRELLAGAVLRPLMMWCTPYYANKVGGQAAFPSLWTDWFAPGRAGTHVLAHAKGLARASAAKNVGCGTAALWARRQQRQRCVTLQPAQTAGATRSFQSPGA